MTAKLLPIARVSNVSQEEFESAILQDRPLIIEGMVHGWKAFARWTPDYLADKIGDLQVRVRSSSTHLHPDFERIRTEWERPLLLRLLAHARRRIGARSQSGAGTIAFRAFLDLLTNSPDAFRYLVGAEELGILRDGRWSEELSPLRADYEIPPLVPPSKLDSMALWVSARGVRSHLHYDGSSLHNLNAQVSGSKHVQLYSPAQMAKLYPYLHTDGRPYTFSQVNVEDVDHARFPLFGELEGYEGTLEAGDMLFIPAFWYHTFKHLGTFNTNVNFWWRADFVRLSPVAARDYFGGLAFDVLSQKKIPPFWLAGWFRQMERRITQIP